ncbi:hypothetical protein BASA62_006268 [Batrachochytrium salamandrivorans]|nr:hypothetical protein BASA62_006268 [Batrachochytrium salamandrivorans]
MHGLAISHNSRYSMGADTLHSDTTSYFSADRHYARTLPQHLPSPTQHRALQPTSIPPHTSTRYGNRHGLVCAPAIYDDDLRQVQPSCHLSPSLSRVRNATHPGCTLD